MIEEYCAFASFCVYLFWLVGKLGCKVGSTTAGAEPPRATFVKIVVSNLLGLGCTCVERRGLLAPHGPPPIAAWSAA
jgi:hypothetical protein